MAPEITREEAEEHVEAALEDLQEAKRIIRDAEMVGKAFLDGEIPMEEFDERLEATGVDRLHDLLFHH